ncbi:MAG: S46 family peptidase [Pseudoxanthomonas suwonensis]|nr:S46 family peptidase [Pseudoxanthomonas suwonensis]
MWVPQQLPEISDALRKAGLKLDPRQLADLTGDPLGAVVSLGGCTASFVSPQGLVATNHHCAYGAIQLNSTPENNLLVDGFNPANVADEVSAGPNARIFVLEAITDVTADVTAALAAQGDDTARAREWERLSKQLVAECEREDGYRCTLYSFGGGNQYRLFRNLEIRDVRLAYAPPGSVGAFGGDIDNWMWPRHTGDFSFYRAYVGKDGKPAAYSIDNVPYQPKRWLTVSQGQLGAGDFVMVAGYPGRTNRYALADEFAATQQWEYPWVGARYGEVIALIETAGKADPDIAVKYANTMAGLQNVSKNYAGQLEGFRRIDALATKRAEEAAVLDWLRTRGAEGQAALQAHERLVQRHAQASEGRQARVVLGQLQRGGLIGSAMQLYRLSIEKTRDDAERAAGYQQRNLPGIEGGLRQMERRYHPAMDRQLTAYWLQQYLQLPDAQRNAALDAWLGGNDAAAVERALDRLYTSRLGELEQRLHWFGADRAAFEASDDPAIALAVALTPTVLEQEEKARAGTGRDLLDRPLFLQAVADYRATRGQSVYPDANSSLRITFGNVTGYCPRDGVQYTPFTTLEGVVAKETGEEPFDSPKPLLEAVATKRHGGLEDPRIGSVPVNFLADMDVTGGNSGSPVLDANGHLTGLLFDGNWESVSSNWVFDTDLTRTISVDARYMRWIMQEVFPAPRLLQEMSLPTGAP